MGSPSLQEFVTLYLNEVLSIRAQESGRIEGHDGHARTSMKS